MKRLGNILIVLFLFLSLEAVAGVVDCKMTTTQKTMPLVASYKIENSWQTGYQVLVTLKNNSTKPTTSWSSTFSLPLQCSVSDSWNGNLIKAGQNYTVTNPSWSGGGVIPAGGQVTFGMIVQKPSNVQAQVLNLTAVANGTNPVVVPIAPSLNPITVSGTNPGNYTVSWNAVSNATSYTLQQSPTSTFSNPVTIAQDNVLSHSFSSQSDGVYYYRVSSTNTAGTSAYSNVQSVTVQSAIHLDAPVLDAISNDAGASNYTIHWNAVPLALKYTLQESQTPDFTNPVTIISSAMTSFAIAGKSVGTYFYRVIAVNGNSVSFPSNIQSTTVANVTPASPLKTPFLESYWESWNSASSIQTIVNMKVDVISISFANFTTTGTHTFVLAGVEADLAKLTDLVTLAHQLGKKVKVSLGGATYPISPQLKTVDDAIGMAHALADYVAAYSLDGVDLDIEDYPAPALQIALIQNLRQLLGTEALISYTPKTPAAQVYPYNDVIKAAHTYLTDISFMAYDYGPGYIYQQDIQALLAFGVPSTKLVIGLMPGMDDVGVMTSLADIQGAAHFAVLNNLGGIMFWDLNRDHENMTGLGIDAATNAAWPILHP